MFLIVFETVEREAQFFFGTVLAFCQLRSLRGAAVWPSAAALPIVFGRISTCSR